MDEFRHEYSRWMVVVTFAMALVWMAAACSDSEPKGYEGEEDAGDTQEPTDTGASTPDATDSSPDTGDDEEDTGSAEECSEVCGDLTGDGEVSGEDVLRLSEIVDADEEPTECEFSAGDILGDGELGPDDVEMLQGLIDGSVTGGCESCELSCGDANADGDVTVADLTQVADVIENDATLSVCQFQAADVKGDGVIDEADLQGIMDIINDFSEGACEPCEVACGDITQDGSVGPSDVELLQDVVAGEESLGAICPRWAADVNGDGTIDDDDLALLEAHVDDGLEISCAGEEGEAGELDPVVDCTDREQLPSDWHQTIDCRPETANSDCRTLEGIFGNGWPMSSSTRLMASGFSSDAKEYLAVGFNSGNISSSVQTQFEFANPQSLSSVVTASKLITISKCPGDFNQEAIESEMGPGCYTKKNPTGTFLWAGTDSFNSIFRCALEPNTQYYLNIVATEAPAGTDPSEITPHPNCEGNFVCGHRYNNPSFSD